MGNWIALSNPSDAMVRCSYLAWKFFSHLREVLTITLSKVIGVMDAGNKEAQSIPTVDRMELTKLNYPTISATKKATIVAYMEVHDRPFYGIDRAVTL